MDPISAKGIAANDLLLHLVYRFRGQRGLNALIQFMSGEPSHQALWDAHLFQVTVSITNASPKSKRYGKMDGSL